MTAPRVRELHTMEDFDTAAVLYAGIWGTEQIGRAHV